MTCEGVVKIPIWLADLVAGRAPERDLRRAAIAAFVDAHPIVEDDLIGGIAIEDQVQARLHHIDRTLDPRALLAVFDVWPELVHS